MTYDLPFIALPTDQPHYEQLADMTMEQKRALPGRFHTPVWSMTTPGLFACRVCWVEGEIVSWPCEPALAAGEHLFTHPQQPLRHGQHVRVGDRHGRVLADPHPTTRVQLDGANFLPGNFPTRFVHALPHDGGA
jgi:hypothetical protein